MQTSKISYRFFIFLFTLFSVSSFAQSSNSPKTYHVTHVVDGDTFDATDGHLTFRVRMAAVDAPESKQDFGQWATTELRNLIENKDVAIEPAGKKGLDKFNRILARIFIKEQDVSLMMVEKGLATYYRPRCNDFPEDKKLYPYDPRPYVEAESRARSTHTGIWSRNNFQLPCAYRKKNQRH